MLGIFLWWLSGILGIAFIVVLYEDVRVPDEITLGDVVSVFLEACLGPVIWCFILLGFLCGEERPKFESKVILKGKK